MFLRSSEELAVNKLLILYILDKMEIPLTNSQITQVIMENEFVDYFSLQQFISELVQSNFIKILNEEGKDYYSLTEKSIEALEYFISRIPEDMKEKIDKYVLENKENILKETQIKSNFYKKGPDEFVVNLKVIEKHIELINIDLNVPSNKQAKLICDNWKKNAPDIYGEIIQLLIKKP
ncbi:protein of unknown function [Alkalithermobacter thermoalcaliphilus JW-YL-7 = DSM 7308]|uniref:DUF4364 family protein n=1 Tax=Alkalithermobacter thermoalcaliphilus JW-YL-7 = DSM 7308 TaxID=1121328 RepID=A0A150FRS5_CLOPD|nr:Protein of unknown function DUF4364 [[Clostridium] paradoxum JW-YL-7 = DSM 7308]SHK39144.1 protein of unknown function [[Clostridium] paradoxum JW-YL-7 = DSM 7308]